MIPGSVHVANLGKAYKQYLRRGDRLIEFATLGRVVRHGIHWVFRDVSFSVSPGESVAIIGRNGAGKSTLLKIITGATQPTEGTAAVAGRVSSLLELGMGFHPEFTGRQNVVMAGQLLGFSEREVTGNLSAIEEFAEIGSYFDQPLRTYSSGMHVRLAFSVATCIRPDILIVDEALAVGDIYFQHKCFRRIMEFKDAGSTLLFVSHDAGAVKRLCNRALLLDEGRVKLEGDPATVLDYYNALIAQSEGYAISVKDYAPTSPTENTVDNISSPFPAAEENVVSKTKDESEDATDKKTVCSGTGEARTVRVQFQSPDGTPLHGFSPGQRVVLDVFVEVFSDIPQLVLGILFRDRVGNEVFGTNTFHHRKVVENVKRGESLRFRFALTLNLGPGQYGLGTMLVSSDTHLDNNYEWVDGAFFFTVDNGESPRFIGSSFFPAEVEVERLMVPLPH